VKPVTAFTVSRSIDEPAPEFALHEQRWFEYGRIDGVRGCLEQHLNALRQRADALASILATDDPERAERLLFDQVDVVAKEVTLRPRSSFTAFEAFMEGAFKKD
jgi:hypothetical protein